MKKIVVCLLVFLLAFSMSLTACKSGQNESTDSGDPNASVDSGANANWPDAVTLSGGPMGGPWYPYMVQLAEVLTREIPEITWTAIEGSSVGNIRLVDAGVDAQIGLTHLNILAKAVNGTLEATAGEAFNRVKAGIAINCSYVYPVVKANNRMQSMADVKNAKFSPGLASSGPESLMRDVLTLYDLDYDKVRANGGAIDFVNYSEMTQLLQDGHLDMGIYSGNMQNASVMELAASTPIRILPWEEGTIERLLELYPTVTVGTVPANTYNGQTEAVDCLAVIATMLWSDKLPDDLVYKIARTIMENSDAMRAENQDLFFLTWDDALISLPEELAHPEVWKAVNEGPSQ
jgi:TRAP transporter TAXI family solute receptor